MPSDDIFKEPLEDNLPPEPEAELPKPSKENHQPEACFPSNDYGMPLALLEIPARERPWFWKDGKYRGMKVAHVKVQAPEHAYLFAQKRHRAFYVHDKQGNLGLVPFPNSTVVWPWEQAWLQDLAPENKIRALGDPKPGDKKGTK